MTSWPSGWGWSDPSAIPPPGLYQQQRAGVPVTVHTSLQVDSVFTCLRVISNAVIKLGDPRAYTETVNNDNVPYRVWEKTQPSILTNTFGPYQMQYDGRRRTIMSLGLFGEAFWYTLEQSGGYATAIEVLHPAFMKIEADPQGGPLYIYGTGVNRRELDADKVTHIPFMSMPGASRGLSAIEYGGIVFAIAIAAMEYGQRWFAQGASPGFLLSTEQKLGTEEVERLAQKFLIEHSGLQSAHLPLVVDSGLNVQKISSTPDEAQFINTLNYARACIASYFGLPSHLVGGEADKGNVWGKTVQEQSMQFLQWTLSGYLIPIEEAFSRLLPAGMKAAFNEHKLAMPDSQMLAQEIMALRQTQVMTINDIRVDRLGLPPKSDPAADEIIAPMASNTAPDQTVPQPFGAPGESTKPGATAPATPGAPAGASPAAKPESKSLEALDRLETAVIAARLQDELRQQRADLLEMVRSLVGRDAERDDLTRQILTVIREASNEHIEHYRSLVLAFGRQQSETNDTFAAGQTAHSQQMTLFAEGILEVASAIRDSRPVVNVEPSTDVVVNVIEEPEPEKSKPEKVVRRRTPQLNPGGKKKVEKVVKRRARGVTPDPEVAQTERRYREEMFAMARAIARRDVESRQLIETITEASASQLGELREALDAAVNRPEPEQLDVQALIDGMRGLVNVEPHIQVDVEAPIVDVQVDVHEDDEKGS